MAQERTRGRTVRSAVLPLTLATVLALAACTVDDVAEDAAEDAVGDVEPEAPDAAPDDVGEAPAEAGDAPADADGAPAERAGEEPLALPEAEVRMLVRDGEVTVAYEEGFAEAYDELAGIVERLDGAVTGVDSERDDGGAMTGTVTVEVPVQRYGELLREVRGLGEEIGAQVTTDELTGEYVDLQSRLRHLEAQEQFYLGLFDDAEGVDDALAIQRHLEDVQLRKEEVSGRIQQIEQQTSRSTLRVRLVPPDAVAEAGAGDDEPGRLLAYWESGVDALVTVTGTMLVVVLGSAPLALAALVLAALTVAVVRSLRRRPGEFVASAGERSADGEVDGGGEGGRAAAVDGLADAPGEGR